MFILFIFISALSAFSANGRICSPLKVSNEALMQWREEMNCRDLNVGDRRTVIRNDQKNSTPIKASDYVVFRKSENEFQIDIPLDINPSAANRIKNLLSLPLDAGTEMMKKNIALCADTLSYALKGPNQEQIILNPILQSEQKTMWQIGLAPTEIKTTEPDRRPSARNYPANINCQSVVHELLHLTGLVDEYFELASTRPDETTARYPCRVLSPSTIMSEHDQAFDDFESRNEFHYKISGDVCSPNQKKNCRSYQFIIIAEDQPSKKEMIQGLKQRDSPSGIFIDPKSSVINLKFDKVNPPGKINRNSVLEPAHFRAIVYPGCQKKNAIYYKCAQYAYITNEKSDRTSCNIPQECQNGDWLK